MRISIGTPNFRRYKIAEVTFPLPLPDGLDFHPLPFLVFPTSITIKSMSTIVVVGATGFLGSNLVLHLKKRHKVVALFRRQMIHFHGTSRFVYSFDDRDFVKRLFTALRPDAIVYAAGLQDIMECHLKPQIADTVHGLGAVFFGSAAEAVPHRYIYLSTAYIYDGKRGNYTETDTPLTETNLGRSKIAGENYIRTKSPMHTIFRMSPVYGVGSIWRPSFVDKLRADLSAGKRHELPENEHHSFTPLQTVLEAVEWAILNENKNDIFCLSGLTKLSTYEFGLEVAKTLGLDEKLIIPSKGAFKEASFLDFSLNASKFVKESQIKPLVLEQGLDLLQKQLIR